MNVVGFLHAIGGQFTAALAVAARVRKQDRITVFQQQASISGNAFAIVSNSVQQNYSIAVVVARMDKPALKHHSISRRDRHILQFSVEISLHGSGNGLPMSQRKAMEFEADIGYDDARQNGQNQVHHETRDHSLTKNMTLSCRLFQAFGRIHVPQDE